MTPERFAQLRDKITQRHGRTNAWRKRAFRRLLAEAGAVAHLTNGRTLSYRLATGKYVCVKQRFATEGQALGVIEQINLENDGRKKPTRAYPCFFCMGWHVTSEVRTG